MLVSKELEAKIATLTEPRKSEMETRKPSVTVPVN
jgi:hypothetical protein